MAEILTEHLPVVKVKHGEHGWRFLANDEADVTVVLAPQEEAEHAFSTLKRVEGEGCQTLTVPSAWMTSYPLASLST